MSKLFQWALLLGLSLLAFNLRAGLPTPLAERGLFLTDPADIASIVRGSGAHPLSATEVGALLLGRDSALAHRYNRGAYPAPDAIEAFYESPLPVWTLRGLWTFTLLMALGNNQQAFGTVAGVTGGLTAVYLAVPLGHSLYRRHLRLDAGNALVDFDNALLDAAGDQGPRLRGASLWDPTWRAVLVPGWGLVYNGHPWIGGIWGLGAVGLLGYGLAIEHQGYHPYSDPEVEHRFVVAGTILYGASVLFSILSARPARDLRLPSTRFGLLPQPGGGLLALARDF